MVYGRDVFYTADIPSDYRFADWHEYYVDFYNTSSPRNGNYTYYRFYFNVSPGTYIQGERNFSNSYYYTFEEYPTSSDWWTRSDVDSILVVVLIISLFFLFLCNFVTSITHKGGVLGGFL